jgi:hypothetical protein
VRIDPKEGDRRQAPRRSRAALWALAELLALTGLVIAQPVLDVTGRSPDMFLFRRADRLDILALVVAVSVLPALGIWVVEVLVGLVSGTARRHLHLAAITVLFTLLAVEVVKTTTDLRGPCWAWSPRPAACSRARCTPACPGRGCGCAS